MEPTESRKVEFTMPDLTYLGAWHDVPRDIAGRLVVRYLPTKECTDNGLFLPESARERPVGVCWVVRVSADCPWDFRAGDSVLFASYALSAAISLPKTFGQGDEQKLLVDAREAQLHFCGDGRTPTYRVGFTSANLTTSWAGPETTLPDQGA